MNIKPNKYYKRYYDAHYSIWCTDNKWIYKIAYKPENQPLRKYTKKEVWTIREFQDFVNIMDYNKIEEISKEDVFLELL